MKRIAILYLSSIVLFTGFILPQIPKEVPFTVKNYQNLANYFDTKEDLLDFFEFKKGDVVADVGAYKAQYEGAFSLLTDSITFYAQDINKKKLNQKTINKMVRHYTKLKGKPLTNTFKFVIGTEKETNLPDGIFDKIILSSVFHELKYRKEMMLDITKKLKPDGKIYILETHCYTKTHYNLTCEEVGEMMLKYGFRPIKKHMPKAKATWSVVYEKVK